MNCMRWEEELYWTHFQTFHFSQLLRPGFENSLAIPQKFSTHCKRKLPQTVTLKSPSGATYSVTVEEDDEKTLAFGCGWDMFVEDHSLQENDLLIFKFHGASELEVLIFDGETLCEKPTCYFVKKCGHAGTSSTSHQRIFNPDDVETTLNQQPVLSPLGYELDDLLIDIDVDIDTTLTPYPLVSQTACEQQVHSINFDIDTVSAQPPVISPTSTIPLNDNLDPEADVEMISAGSERNALSLAERAISPNGFLVVMKRSHVLAKCFLSVPTKWCTKKMLLSRQEVVMQVDQTKWDMTYNYYGSRGRGGISTGWKKFVQDNDLRESDVCVFEPVSSETRPLHLNVYIFRAAEAESSNNG